MRENVRESEREDALMEDHKERDRLRQSRVEKVIGRGDVTDKKAVQNYISRESYALVGSIARIIFAIWPFNGLF